MKFPRWTASDPWVACLLLTSYIPSSGALGPSYDEQDPLNGVNRFRNACPDYTHYAASLQLTSSYPLSDGPLKLPFQRPSIHCRTFSSPAVEKVIEDVTSRMKDKDLARLFENAFPNTLDTTVRWHDDGKGKKRKAAADGAWEAPQSFIVTGDIDAEWLRDSTNQLAQYQRLAKKDARLEKLLLGAINTQVEYIIESPYCNAFQPPPPSELPYTANGQPDTVHPAYEPSFVFECKYELDSLAHFLALGNQFYEHTGSTAFMRDRWYLALKTLMQVMERQSESTFDPKTGAWRKNEYSFERRTTTGTETLVLGGTGNPLNYGSGLIRSAFRPSDDSTILGFYIPANAMMAVELQRTADMLVKAGAKEAVSDAIRKRGKDLEKAVWEHGVVKHPRWGEVFAYEVDGYGSHILMDDANVPSLLALPLLGFVDVANQTYQNTRKMILSKDGNPYYLEGKQFRGIGGPHIGLQNAWPMSVMLQIMTSTDDEEIMDNLNLVRNVSRLGLINESIQVDNIYSFTRSWFAWANSVFAQTILDLAERKPQLLFEEGKQESFVVS